MQPVFVSRASESSRTDSVNEIKRRVAGMTAAASGENRRPWQQIALFPEGTTTNRKCLISFKTGAFQPGVPVQPVVVRWPNYFDCVTWAFVGPSIWKLLWLQLCQFHTFLEIEYLPIYEPNDEEKSNPALYANNVRHVMASALKIPAMDFSYRDGLEFQERYTLARQPPSDKLKLLNTIHDEIGMKLEMMEDWLPMLLKRYRSTPLVSQEDFCDLLDVSQEYANSRNLQSFSKMIYTPQGEVDLKQYIYLSCLWCCQQSKKLHYLRHVFQLCGHDDLNALPEGIVREVLLLLNIKQSPECFFKLNFISFDYFLQKLQTEKLVYL